MKKYLDCKMMTSRVQAHEYIAAELDFPEYYGKNADALFDCLNEYSGMIVLKNTLFLRENLGCGPRILHAFYEADISNPNLSVVIFEADIPPENKFHKKLERLEFVMTYACTGKCRHCSEAGKDAGFRLDGSSAATAVLRAAAVYNISSVMAFGGEPLLCIYELAKIMRAAKNAGVMSRQIITSGFFSRDKEKISRTVQILAESGINDVLLSVDAFHQETIPLEPVKLFAKELIELGVSVRTNPAWLVSKDDSNRYNLKTRELVSELEALGAAQNGGNIIFPEGNALRYLGEYFNGGSLPENPYKQNPEDVRAICVNPDCTLYGEDIRNRDILEILEEYVPEKQNIQEN